MSLRSLIWLKYLYFVCLPRHNAFTPRHVDAQCFDCHLTRDFFFYEGAIFELDLCVFKHANDPFRFAGQVKLHALLIYTAPTPAAPKNLKLFKNRDDLDFSTASELTPTQKIEVPQPVPGTDVFEIPLNRALWNTTTSITLFVEDNWGDEETTKVGYIGFKGHFMALNREPVNVMYEAAANPSDHVAIPGVQGMGGRVMPGQ
jgi:hypothetical protein